MCSVLCAHIIAHTPRNPQYLFSIFLKNIFSSIVLLNYSWVFKGLLPLYIHSFLLRILHYSFHLFDIRSILHLDIFMEKRDEKMRRGGKAGSEEKRLGVRRDDTVAFCLNYSGKSVNIPLWECNIIKGKKIRLEWKTNREEDSKHITVSKDNLSIDDRQNSTIILCDA